MAPEITIRVAATDELAQIKRLADTEYKRRGYGPYTCYPQLEAAPETTRVVAVMDKRIAGTCTISLDGSCGLSTEVDYPRETAAIRSLGLPMACVWRLAVERGKRGELLECVAHQMMTFVARFLVDVGEPVLLCEVHPRHAAYYTKRFGFLPFAKRSETHGLHGAPSVLMIGGPGTYSRVVRATDSQD